MPLNKSRSEEAFNSNVAELIKAGHPREQALAIAYKIMRGEDDECGMDYASSREYDVNGWPEIKNNPLSRVGVFPYSGRQISPELEPDKIYMVYRPEEELANPACIDSFKLLPWVDEHPPVLLGPEEAGRMSPEKKGIGGVIGEDVYFDNGILYGNIKMFTDELQEVVNSGEHRELSLGYGCRYEIQSGTWNGIRYDVIQRDIRGNHLAAVPQGRMGPEIHVLDHLTFTFDAKDAKMPEEKEKEGESKLTLDDVVSALKEMGPKIAHLHELVEKHFTRKEEGSAADDDDMKGKKAATDDDYDDMPDESATAADDDKTSKDDDKKEKAMDAAFDALRAELNGLKKGMLQDVAKRNALASRLSQFVGSFDAAEMTAEEVAKYGVEKLGLNCPAGHEQTALDAYMLGRVPQSEVGFSFDASTATGSDVITNFFNKSE